MTPKGPIRTLPTAERMIFGLLTLVGLAMFVGVFLFPNISGGTTKIRIKSDFEMLWIVGGLEADVAASVAYDPERYTPLLRESLSISQSSNPKIGLGEGQTQFRWYYPPQFWLILRPFGLMPFLAAYLVWQLGGLALLAMVARVIYRFDWPGTVFLTLCPAALCNLYLGQTGTLAAALLMGGLGLLYRKPIWAGIFFALLTFKPTMGVLLPFCLLAGRHWLAFLSATLATFALIGLSLVVLGVEAWTAFLAGSLSSAFDIHTLQAGSWVVNYKLSLVRALRAAGLDYNLAMAGQYLLSAVVAVTVIWVFVRPGRPDLKAACLLAGTVLATPYIHIYDVAGLAMAGMLLMFFCLADGGRPGERSMVVLAWLAPLLALFTNAIGLPLAPIFLLLPFIALVLRAWREASISTSAAN